MSAVPQPSFREPFAGLRMSAAEYLALGETEQRFELIDGVVVMSPSPLPNHQDVVVELIYQLAAFARNTKSILFYPDTDVEFSNSTVYRPDISAYRAERFTVRPRRLSVPPDLAIEVLSGGSKGADLITKRDDYDRFGVAEYWVVDPTTARLRCWRRGPVTASRPVTPMLEADIPADRVASSALPGFALDLAPIKALVVPPGP